MGRLINLIVQKFLPSAKKSFWIDFRKKGGAWASFLISPSKTSFKVNGIIYYLRGRPEIDNFTNQRKFVFLEGIPYPILFDENHEHLLKINADFGNIALQMTEADEQGFQRALLLKSKKGIEPITLIMIIVGITLLLVLLNLYFSWTIINSFQVPA